MARPRKNPADKKTKSVTRVKKLKDILTGQTTPQEAENRRQQLKALIILGKERGYLTHSEINDHLPMKYLKVNRLKELLASSMIWESWFMTKLRMLKLY